MDEWVIMHRCPLAAGPDWYLLRVELTVLDVNDNAPEWTMVPFPYLAVVSPSAAPSTLVYKLTARDGDEGINGEVEYFLSDGKTAPFIISFGIDRAGQCRYCVLKQNLMRGSQGMPDRYKYSSRRNSCSVLEITNLERWNIQKARVVIK